MHNFDRGLVAFLIVALLVSTILVVMPFVSSIMWAGILCFATWPGMTWLSNRLGGKYQIAALILTFLWIFAISFPILLVMFNFASTLKYVLSFSGNIEIPPAPDFLGSIPLIGEALVAGWSSIRNESGMIVKAIKPFAGDLSGFIIRNGSMLAKTILEISISMLFLYFFYAYGHSIARFTRKIVERLIGEQADHYLDLIAKTVQRVVSGIIGTALAQAFLASIGFWIAGVPGIIVLTVLTFFLSLIPAGPPLIWIPATMWLFFEGQHGNAAFLCAWGFLVISGIDNIVKPYLISRGGNLPLIVVLIGVFGGLIAFGLIGLFIGPAILAIAYKLIEDWTKSKSLE